MKIFVTGLSVSGALIIATLLGRSNIPDTHRAYAIVAIILVINCAMLWSVVYKHR